LDLGISKIWKREINYQPIGLFYTRKRLFTHSMSKRKFTVGVISILDDFEKSQTNWKSIGSLMKRF